MATHWLMGIIVVTTAAIARMTQPITRKLKITAK
jgi:hypothetical protein